jgi:hypothetical protein
MSRFIAWSSVAAVVLVAAVAGWVSYLHAWEVIRAHGEPGMVGRLYPATVDGLIYMSSMVLLDAARRRQRAPAIARWLLAAGIAATLFANVVAGLSHGPLGAAIASWPALALVGSYELLMALMRARSVQPASEAHRAAQGHSGADTYEHVSTPVFTVPAGDQLAQLFGPQLSTGQIPGVRQIKRTAKVGTPRAQEIQAHLQEVLGQQSQNGHRELAPAP